MGDTIDEGTGSVSKAIEGSGLGAVAGPAMGSVTRLVRVSGLVSATSPRGDEAGDTAGDGVGVLLRDVSVFGVGGRVGFGVGDEFGDGVRIGWRGAAAVALENLPGGHWEMYDTFGQK